MSEYRFSVIVASATLTHDDILNAADAFGNAGCTDASVRGHAIGMELLFYRQADSLEEAIRSAIGDVRSAKFDVARVEMEPDAVLQTI